MNAENLFEQIRPEFIKAFNEIPKFGALGFHIHFHNQVPVRIDWSGSKSKKLLPKSCREVV